MKRLILLTMLLLAACAPAAPREDPNISLAIAQARLTGTAQAWQMQQAVWTVTAQSWTPTPSLTPVPTSTATITPTPTVDVTGTMAVEYMNAELRDLEREQTRKDATNTVLAWMPYLVLALSILFALFIGYVGARRLAMVPTPIHEATGKPLPMLNVIDGVVSDIDRAPNGMAVMNRKYVRALPLITAERQDVVTNRAQAVDMKSRSKVTSEAVRKLLENQGIKLADETKRLEAPNLLSAGSDALFPLPDWSAFEHFTFEPNKPLPFASRGAELAAIDINQNPHVAVIGPSGAGKSRYCMRTLICSAAAAGNQVVVMGDMVDYSVFGIHPNVTLVPVENLADEKDAEKYVGVLRVILQEMTRRYSLLAEKGISTWDRAGGQNTVLFLDELGVGIELLEMNKKQDMANWAKVSLSVLAKKGRKAGMNIVFSSQRAVGLQNLLSQVETFLFGVKNSNEERYAFGESGFGATDLQKGYFLSRVGSRVSLNGAFQPTDEQVGNFLLGHRVESTDKPQWIEGVYKTIEPTADTPKISAPKNEIEELAESIRKEWNPEMSGRQVAALLGKSYAGWWKDKTDQVIAVLKNHSLEGAI